MVITMRAHCFHDSLVMVKCIVLFKVLQNFLFDSGVRIYFWITWEKIAEVRSEPSQASNMELFVKSVNS